MYSEFISGKLFVTKSKILLFKNLIKRTKDLGLGETLYHKSN